MIIISGAAGFIGSCLVSMFNRLGRNDLILVDDFSRTDKLKNLEGKKYIDWVHRDVFALWIDSNYQNVMQFYHLGARTNTTEWDKSIFDRLNYHYSKMVWEVCVKYQIPLVYASSAATYGDGKLGYSDDHSLAYKLAPLNPYGISKNDFDKWALEQEMQPPNWYGLKFFNVYGPNEYHKGRMASVILHASKQIKETGKVKLFKSHHPDFEHGQQKRDFIYVKDVIEVCASLLEELPESGLYNLGKGEARTFEDLVKALFSAMEIKPKIEFIDMPEDLREKYQYFTEADMGKLKNTDTYQPTYSIETGVADYYTKYLDQRQYY